MLETGSLESTQTTTGEVCRIPRVLRPVLFAPRIIFLSSQSTNIYSAGPCRPPPIAYGIKPEQMAKPSPGISNLHHHTSLKVLIWPNAGRALSFATQHFSCFMLPSKAAAQGHLMRWISRIAVEYSAVKILSYCTYIFDVSREYN